MAITNAQQYKQLVNPPMKGKKRPGYRGDDAARSDRAARSEGRASMGRADPGNAPRGDGPETGAPNQGLISEIRRQNLEKAPDVFQRPLRQRISNFISRANPLATLLGFINPALGLAARGIMGLKGRGLNLFRGQTPDYSNMAQFNRLGLFGEDPLENLNKGRGSGLRQPITPIEMISESDMSIPMIERISESDMSLTPEQRQLIEDEQVGDIRGIMAADGGRIGAQEGGIMPRLNQLGSGVSSAEQMLQGINQRLESAESSLGGGGAMQQPVGSGFMQPAGLSADVATSAGISPGPQVNNLSGYDQRGPFNVKDAYANAQKEAQKTRAGGFLGQIMLPGEMSFDDFSNMFTPSNNFGQPMQLPASGGLSGIPAASYADGGVIGGGIMDAAGRQQYFLGKLVKKAKRAVKKIVKSPVGKLGIGAALLGGLTPGGFKGLGKFILKNKELAGAAGLIAAPFIFGQEQQQQPTGFTGPVGGQIDPRAYTDPYDVLYSAFRADGSPKEGEKGNMKVAGYLDPMSEKNDMAMEMFGKQLKDLTDDELELLDEEIDRLRSKFMADGGSTEKEPVAKKTMPLLDMGGQEMDLRDNGGFVPIGRMEKADDVPARLSKNEFVFTADAVRNAGDGDVDKGAEVMYNMMKNLEAGGDVSEESQGLKGARKMFQTSQRLEEVL